MELVVDESLEPCEDLDMFGKECPIEAGHLIISEDVLSYGDNVPEASRITPSHHGSRAHWRAHWNATTYIPQAVFYTQISVTRPVEQITCFGGEITS